MKRKHISWKTKCAAVLALWDGVPYDHLKLMTEDQFLSLYQFDHNILHESGHEDRDKFWNLKPMPIQEHREKTERDLKIIAKGRRLRKSVEERPYFLNAPSRHTSPRRKIHSRDFDKRFRRKMDGTVVPK